MSIDKEYGELAANIRGAMLNLEEATVTRYVAQQQYDRARERVRALVDTADRLVKLHKANLANITSDGIDPFSG